MKVSLSQDLYLFGIRDTLHLVPSVPHGDDGQGGRYPALCLSGYFPIKVPHIGDIPDVSAARHVMNVPVVLRKEVKHMGTGTLCRVPIVCFFFSSVVRWGQSHEGTVPGCSYHILGRLSTALFCCLLIIFSVYTLVHKLVIRGQGPGFRVQGVAGRLGPGETVPPLGITVPPERKKF